MTQETERVAFEKAFEKAWENDTTGWSGFAWHIWQAATAEAEARYAPKINALRGLLNRGLDLCAIGRNLDKQIEEAPPHHCATPYVWAMEKYAEQLAQWERDASNALALAKPLLGKREGV
jgi:hypothetical protein